MHEADGIASIAALPVSSAIVSVGPPLFCRPLVSRSRVETLLALPVAEKLQLASSDRL